MQLLSFCAKYAGRDMNQLIHTKTNDKKMCNVINVKKLSIFQTNNTRFFCVKYMQSLFNRPSSYSRPFLVL